MTAETDLRRSDYSLFVLLNQVVLMHNPAGFTAQYW